MSYPPVQYPELWPADKAAKLVDEYLAASLQHTRILHPLSRLRGTHLVEAHKPNRLLDIGCGGCHIVAHLFENHQPPEGVVGVEPFFPQEVEVPVPFEYHALDMHEATPGDIGTFDLVLGCQSGYRSYNVTKLLAAVAGVLRPGGAAYIDFWTDEIPRQCDVAQTLLGRRKFLDRINSKSTQTLHPCPDPQPYGAEVERIGAAATVAGLRFTPMPFFGRPALRAAYSNHPGTAPVALTRNELIEVLVNDPREAKAACGYFTAALHHVLPGS